MIFLDNASTTRVCQDALEAMKEVCSDLYYNPSALYGEALKVKNLVESARRDIAAMLGADENEIYFTSCATESNNWAFDKGIKRVGILRLQSSKVALAPALEIARSEIV